jgi:hypothetical protein
MPAQTCTPTQDDRSRSATDLFSNHQNRKCYKRSNEFDNSNALRAVNEIAQITMKRDHSSRGRIPVSAVLRAEIGNRISAACST